MKTVTVAEFKRHFSELVGDVRYRGERIIVARRHTPVAALIGLEDLTRLEHLPNESAQSPETEKPKGLLALAGVWAGFPEMERIMDEVYASRQHTVDRPVPPFDG